MDNKNFKEKSESLFITKKEPIPQALPRMSQDQRRQESKEQQEQNKKDYMFKNVLEERFETETLLAPENRKIIQDLEKYKKVSSNVEIDIINRANERKKRHYSLNGEVIVYAYVRNEWPKLIIKPLTVPLDNEEEVPSLGPFKKENEMLLKAVFRPITIEIKNQIDQFIYDPVTVGQSQLLLNYDEYKRLAFICCFKEWNLPIGIETKNNRLTESAIQFIEKELHPKIIDIIMREFISLNEISEKETKALEQQCEKLFAKNSQGIANPTEGIRLYCEASVMAKEFYLSGSDLNDLPYRVASMIRYVSNKSNEIHNRQMEQASKSSNKSAQVAKPRRRK